MEELVGTFKKKQPGYLLWYDDDPKIPTSQKIEEALEAYVKSKRWQKQPNVVLVNELDLVSLEDVTVRSSAHIRRNHFWIGREEAAVAEDAPIGEEAPVSSIALAETIIVEPAVAARKTRAAKKSVALAIATPAEQSTEPTTSEAIVAPTARRARKSRATSSEVVEQIAPVGAADAPTMPEVVTVAEAAPEPTVQRGRKRRVAKHVVAEPDAIAEQQVPEQIVEEAEALAVVEPATRKTRVRKAASLAEQDAVQAAPVAAEASAEPVRKNRRAAKAIVAVDEPVIEAALSEPIVEPIEPVLSEPIVEPAVVAKGKRRRTAERVAALSETVDQAKHEAVSTETQTARKARRANKAAEPASEHVVELPAAVAEPEPQDPAPSRRKAKRAALAESAPVAETPAMPVVEPTPKRRARRNVQPELEQASLPL